MKTLLLIAMLTVGCGTLEYSDTRTERGPKGNPGEAGENGMDGQNGESIQGDKGTSCTTVDTEEGAVITCEDGTSSVVSNGNEGAPGDMGPSGSPGRDAISVVTLYAYSYGYYNNSVVLPSVRRFGVPTSLITYNSTKVKAELKFDDVTCKYNNNNLDTDTCSSEDIIEARQVELKVTSHSGSYYYVSAQLYFD